MPNNLNSNPNLQSPNNSYSIIEDNLEGLHNVDLNTSEWNISPGNVHSEPIPKSLNFKPNVPKMKLPAFLQSKGGKRRKSSKKRVTKRVTKRTKSKRATRHIKHKN
jgi:hypothetical protein